MDDAALLAPFDDDVVRAVAGTNNVDEEQLRSALADHQRTMRENPGVEDLVYEWRKRFDDAVLHRTPETFYMAVRETVWEEYGAHLGIDDYLLAAVVAVHQEQVLRETAVDSSDIDEDAVALVVSRPSSQ
jgi:NACalpha-BTF3-like transcription factor